MNDSPVTNAFDFPAQRIDQSGRVRLDRRAVWRLAFPFMINSAVQAILSATDTWFIGRISTEALAAVAAVYWPVLVFVLLLGGVGMSVQTLVAQAFGARRYRRASAAAWTAIWAAVFTIPFFAALAFFGGQLFSPFGIPDAARLLGLEFWMPRMLLAPLGVAMWALFGFFNGIGRPGISLRITIGVSIVNAILNQIFIFDWHWGIAGSSWATGAAQFLGLAAGFSQFLSKTMRQRFATHLSYSLRRARLRSQFKLGLPMGMLYAADILGFALFQLMQVRLGPSDGAATQVVMMLTSFCYMPAFGIAMAGTTLVGQSIGAGHQDWARRLGNSIIVMVMLYMGIVGLVLALLGPWVMPLMVQSADADSGAVIAKGCVLLWIAAGYQLFDGLQLGSGACLRGAGDAAVPATMVVALSWVGFVPLAYMLTFAPGQGWLHGLPEFGFGVVGGWSAALVYMIGLAAVMNLRWRSGAWRAIELR
jgi:multidrug resistance protein, MATE family